MSIKRAAGIAVGLVGAAFLFAWVYMQYGSDYQANRGSDASSGMSAKSAPTKQPVTADTAVNDMVDSAVAEESEADGAADDELRAIEEETASVSDLAGVYDARDFQ